MADNRFDNFFRDKLGEHTSSVSPDLWDKVNPDQPLDRFVRDKLSNHTAPVPPGLWNKVNPAEKDDRTILLLPRLGLIAAMVAVITGGVLYFTHDTTSGVNTTSLIRPDNATAGHATVNGMTDGWGKSTDTIRSQQDVNAAPENGIAGNAPAGQEAITGDYTTQQHAPSHPAVNTDQRSTGIYAPQQHSQTGSVHTAPGKGQTTEGVDTHSPTYNNTPFGLNSQAGASNPNIPFTNDSQKGADAGKSSATNESSSVEPYNSFVAASTIGYNKDFFSLKNLEDKKLSGRIPVSCPTAKGSGGGNTDWFIELYASPDYAFRSVANNTATPQYLQRKDSSGRMQVSYSAGFRIVKPITDNIVLKTGLQYSQINEKFTYRAENEIKTTTVVTVRTIIRAPGDTVIVSDTSTLQQIGYRTNVIKNRYRSIDVPLTVGYEFGDDDLHFGINAGVIFNISSWYQGVILDTSLTAVPLTKSNNMVYKSNIGLGLYAGFSIMKRVTDDMHLFFEPYFRYNLSNMTTDQASYKQKFSLGGLSIGIRYNLNRR